jgi:type IV pilus assembly protein PilF
MGQAYMKEGQPQIALSKLERGNRLDPDNPQIHAVFGSIYQQLGEVLLADEHLAKASDLDPKNPYYRNARGSLLCQQGRYEEAEKQFQMALGNPLYDRPWQATTNAGLCAHRAGRVDLARNYLRKALARNPHIPQALIKLAEIELQSNNLTQARSYLQRYNALAPHNPQTLLIGYRIENGLGNAEEAKRYLDFLTQGYPDAPETRTAKELNQP